MKQVHKEGARFRTHIKICNDGVPAPKTNVRLRLSFHTYRSGVRIWYAILNPL